MIQPDPGDTQDVVYHAKSSGEEIAKRWGPATVDAMAKVGIRFGEPA